MKNTAHPYLFTTIILVIAILLSVVVGSVATPLKDVISVFWEGIRNGFSDQTTPLASIIFKLRLPRTILIALTGAALASSGAAYQGLFRNPLADPYVIGVASGSGLGAVIAMSIHWPNGWASSFIIPIAAFITGLITVLLVYSLSRVNRSVPATSLVLAGVAISSFTTAITSFIMLKSTGELRRSLVWLLGGSTLSGWQPVIGMLPYVALGIGTLLTMGYTLNVFQFGDEQATQMGLQVEKRRLIVIIAASLTTAAAVSFSGVIGFVGLITPHIIRLLTGGDYRRILPLSTIAGAAFLLLADILARVVLAPQEVPVGIITALAGAPFFIWVLRRSRPEEV
jgi:iron complex transport system permease protein